MSDVEVKTCADEAVVSKYKSASAIANSAYTKYYVYSI